MKTKLSRIVYDAINVLTNILILFFCFLMAYLAIVCAIAVLADFSLVPLFGTLLFTCAWVFLLWVYDSRV